MDKLGQYITQEYGLLKQILRNLCTRELVIASKVCRSWAEVVEVIFTEESQLIWGYLTGPEEMLWLPNNCFKTVPKVIFLNSKYKDVGRSCRSLHCCPCKYGNESTELIAIKDNLFSKFLYLEFPESYDFISCFGSTLLLPSMTGVEVNCISFGRGDKIFDQKVTDCTVNQLIGEEPVKCLLVYTYRPVRKVKKWLMCFLTKVIDRQGENSLAIGGGDAVKLTLLKGKEKCQGLIQVLSLVTFRGDNISAYSQLLKCNEMTGVEGFMNRMANDVGPVPSGSERIAFIVKCINRCHFSLFPGMYEGEKFKEIFPGVRHFGFLGCGEYGINTSTSNCTEAKRKKSLEFIHSNSTSFVILTFHNVKQSGKKL